MIRTTIRASIIFFFLALILCGIYPLTLTVVGTLFFPQQATGGQLVKDGITIGSERIAQGFTRPEYFHPRPSAAGEKGYDAANSGGSNLGPTSRKLYDRIQTEVSRVKSENPGTRHGEIPVELVTASASGLDPHLSPNAAHFQIPRVAARRHLSEEDLRSVVDTFIEPPQLGFLGEPKINVLLLNLELDRLFPSKTGSEHD